MQEEPEIRGADAGSRFKNNGAKKIRLTCRIEALIPEPGRYLQSYVQINFNFRIRVLECAYHLDQSDNESVKLCFGLFLLTCFSYRITGQGIVGMRHPKM